MPALSVFEVHGDRVIGVTGNSSDTVCSRFANEAESLQARARLIGEAIGMKSVICSTAAFEGGSVAFRFSKTSTDGFDVKGLTTDSGNCSSGSLLESLV